MPTQLEELVEFLHHGNTQIRQVAAENLVGFSTAQPSLFKRNQMEPIADLKMLVKDYTPIAKDALTMLINLSAEDPEVLKHLTDDPKFIETVLAKITIPSEPNADLFAMLLANMSKSDNIKTILKLEREPASFLSTSSRLVIDQLLDLFVKGAEGSYNKDANFDYLCYVFADISKHEEGRKHFLTARPEDKEDVIPLSKVVVFTETKSPIRRRGVASIIKNTCFDTSSHDGLISDLDLLPYVFLPLMGPEEYSDEDTEGMPDELQLLPPDKEREKEHDITKIHLDTLLLLTTTREGRDKLREKKTYPIIRELHLQTEDDEVREACDRLVQVLMRDEEDETTTTTTKVDDDEEEDELVEV
ncbi:hypothetical protein AAFC00_001579 [Neodothiora populina]|uniref:Protein HGH1 homolog n=1 Tax=Neodothiora populina TaxID=2781224 RepID=A0ABR3PPD2_9PEZI